MNAKIRLEFNSNYTMLVLAVVDLAVLVLVWKKCKKRNINGPAPEILLLISFNPFKLSGISLSYQLDQSISVLRIVGW